MANEDWEARKRILTLQGRVSELQAMLLLTISEMRALRELTTEIYQEKTGQSAEEIDSSILKMRDIYLDGLISSFADDDINSASQLKQNIEKLKNGKPL